MIDEWLYLAGAVCGLAGLAWLVAGVCGLCIAVRDYRVMKRLEALMPPVDGADRDL